MKIILGSSSQGRQEILKEMGYDFEVMAPDIDEKAIRHEDAKELVLRLGNAKADALIPKIKDSALLITSDQVVAWKDQIREKPENDEEAREFLRTYHEAPAETICSIVVTNTATGKRVSGVDIARVYFKEIPEDVIDKFIGRKDIFWRAGGFSIKDPLLQPYIEKIEGTINSIMGLPKELTERLLKEAQE